VAIDEVYDGGMCTFFATDPLNNKVISFHRSESSDGVELMNFLERLKGMGVIPEVLISDAAPLYQAIPYEIFGCDLRHQVCAFHFLKECMRYILKGVYDFLKTLSKKPARQLKKHNPAEYIARMNEAKERRLIWKNRYSFTSHKEKLSIMQRITKKYLCNKYAVLDGIWHLKEQIFDLYSGKEPFKAVLIKRDGIIKENKDYFTVNKNIIVVLKKLQSVNFEKTLTYLEYENLDKTSNHVERVNRWFRKRQKTHYRNRKEVNIVNMPKADLIQQMYEWEGGTPKKLKRRDSAISQVA